MLYFILRYIARYRLNVVQTNITRSFPEKTEKERALIVNNFYRHFVRQIIESLQFMFISSKKIKQKFKNLLALIITFSILFVVFYILWNIPSTQQAIKDFFILPL